MRRDAVTGDGQTIEAVELPKGLATATNLDAQSVPNTGARRLRLRRDSVADRRKASYED